MPNPRSVFFGSTQTEYTPKHPPSEGFEETAEGLDNGRCPACAINANGRFIEVHMGIVNDTLNFRQGIVERLGVRFTDKQGRSSIADGTNPAVAFSNQNVAIVLAEDDGNKLKYAAATVDIDSSKNPPFHFTKFGEKDASSPSVALNSDGVVLEVHQLGGGVFYRRGKLEGTTLTWAETAQQLDASGSHPSVAINKNGMAVVMYEQNGGLAYRTGTFDESTTAVTDPITFATMASSFPGTGTNPSVALTSRGAVFVTYKSGTGLFQAVGALSAGTITWQDFLVPGQMTYQYDTGDGAASISTNETVALQFFHRRISQFRVLGSASLVFDRANWMNDNRKQLKDRTLRAIAIPGSHDAGAFAENIARTQDLTIGQQLTAGIRYFDLRPKYSGAMDNIDPAKITTVHPIGLRAVEQDFNGPPFIDVVKEIREFVSTHKELVILRISQFRNFNQSVFDALANIFLGDSSGQTGIAGFLFPLQSDGVRLANRMLRDYLGKDHGTVLILVDVDGPNKNPSDNPPDYINDTYRTRGFYRYRDWYAKDPAAGDMTVFDVYSDTDDFGTMSFNKGNNSPEYVIPSPPKKTQLPSGQLNKFLWFDGFCQKDDTDPSVRSTVPCDLFLLSWTLTPIIPQADVPLDQTAFLVAVRANRNLASYLAIPEYQADIPGKPLQMNILYTDAVEFSRSVDVALIRNGLASGA